MPGFEEVRDAVRHHHERWAGGGSPSGLKGEETPLPARLMAVADAYSAMTTDPPYRKAMAHSKALAILETGAGSQWDSKCVQAFLQARQVGTVRAGETDMDTNTAPADGDEKDTDDAKDADDEMDGLPDGDRQLTTGSDALDIGGSNDSDLGADVAGDIGPKHK